MLTENSSATRTAFPRVALALFAVFGLALGTVVAAVTSVGAEVYVVDAEGGRDFETISGALAVAQDGDTVWVRAGVYAESIEIQSSIHLIGAGAAETSVTGGVCIAAVTDGLIIDGFSLSGDHAGANCSSNAVIDSRSAGEMKNMTLRNSVLDGEDVTSRAAFYGHDVTGTWTFDKNEIKNFTGWYVIDNTGSNPAPVALGALVFTDNYIHDVGGTIAFRGEVGDEMRSAVVSGNTFDYSMRTSSDCLCWAALELTDARSMVITGNTITGMPMNYWTATGEEGSPGGKAIQVYSGVAWSLEMSDNVFDGNYMGVLISSGYLPTGAIQGNLFREQEVFALAAIGSFTNPGLVLDASNNDWNSVNGPANAGLSGDQWIYAASVSFTPWIGQIDVSKGTMIRQTGKGTLVKLKAAAVVAASATATLDVSGGVTVALQDSGSLSITQAFTAGECVSSPGRVKCKSASSKSKLSMKASKSTPGTFLVKAKLSGGLPALPATLMPDLTVDLNLPGGSLDLQGSTTDCLADNARHRLTCF